MTACRVCEAKTDAAICHRCAGQIVDALRGLTRDIADLVAVETRQAAGPLGVRLDGRFGECENPERDGTFCVIGENLTELRGWEGWVYAPGAALQLDYIANTVSTWARHLVESRGLELRLRDAAPMAGPTCAPHAHRRPDKGCAATGGLVCRQYHPDHVHRAATKGCNDDCEKLHCAHESCVEIRGQASPLGPVAAWLIDNIAAIRHDEAAAQIHDELTGLALENERSIFGRAGVDEFYGVCDQPDEAVVSNLDAAGRIVVEFYRSDRTCGAQLYGPKDAKTVKCRNCDSRYDVAERKATMRAKLPGSLGTLVEIAGALTSLDEPVTVKTLSRAIERRLIPVQSINADGHRMVRVADVETYLASRQRGKARFAS